MERPPLGSSFNILGLNISWYSLLLTLAVGVGIWLAEREERRLKLPKETIINFSLLAIPLGIIGARLYYVAFTWGRFQNNLIEIIQVWNGGLAIYGAILGGLLAAFIITRKYPATLPSLLDACAPSLILGQAIGRWGNYANMEAYGERIYTPALQFFPLAVQIPILGANGTEFWYWHMATFFYEFLWSTIVFILLMAYRKKMRRRGDVICWYLLLYCAGRTVIEGLRNDSLLLSVGNAQVRISQILSALVCLSVALLFFIRLLKKQKLNLQDVLCFALLIGGIICTFIGEFERNAYQSLFNAAQISLGVILILDLFLLFIHPRPLKDSRTPFLWMNIVILLCMLTLLIGIGRMGENNTAYIALRQSVAMLHVVLTGAWFYLKANMSKRIEDVISDTSIIIDSIDDTAIIGSSDAGVMIEIGNESVALDPGVTNENSKEEQ